MMKRGGSVCGYDRRVALARAALTSENALSAIGVSCNSFPREVRQALRGRRNGNKNLPVQETHGAGIDS